MSVLILPKELHHSRQKSSGTLWKPPGHSKSPLELTRRKVNQMPGERKTYIFRHRAGFSIGCAVNLFAIWSAMAKASSGLCALETRLQMTVNIHSMSASSHSSPSFSLKTDKTLAAAGPEPAPQSHGSNIHCKNIQPSMPTHSLQEYSAK
jgi:hypothetical protein